MTMRDPENFGLQFDMLVIQWARASEYRRARHRRSYFSPKRYHTAFLAKHETIDQAAFQGDEKTLTAKGFEGPRGHWHVEGKARRPMTMVAPVHTATIAAAGEHNLSVKHARGSARDRLRRTSKVLSMVGVCCSHCEPVCETSVDVIASSRVMCSAFHSRSLNAPPYDGSLSVRTVVGAKRLRIGATVRSCFFGIGPADPKLPLTIYGAPWILMFID